MGGNLLFIEQLNIVFDSLQSNLQQIEMTS
jgi:hypothetical protein